MDIAVARTPVAPVVKEVKPTAAIAWQSIAFGPVRRGRRPMPRYDAVAPVVLEEALDKPTKGCASGWSGHHRRSRRILF